MICGSCGKDNLGSNQFCTGCGNKLFWPEEYLGVDEDEGNYPETLSLTELTRKVIRLERGLSNMKAVLQRGGFVRSEQEETGAVPSSPSSRTVPVPINLASTEKEELSGSSEKKTSFLNMQLDVLSFERLVGLNWLAIVGALALALGVGFFLKLALDYL